MKRIPFTPFARRYFIEGFLKRGQVGQSIIILAIGFVALLGFVGIVTDVSLLFVRYSSLSRAVDAAAVSAAGQMRRIPDGVLDRGGAGTLAVSGEAASNATLSLAARQFIEVYGISPSTVLVETCRVQRFRDGAGNPVDRNGVPLYPAVTPPFPNPDDLAMYEELCTAEELKLVRVTSQIDVPTMFMQLFGYRTVTLTVSAISQTAVLDVVLVMDVSESMLQETRYSDYENNAGTLGWTDPMSGGTVGYGRRYLPRRFNFIRDYYLSESPPITDGWVWSEIVTRTQADILLNGRPNYPTPATDTLDAGIWSPLSFVPASASPTYPQIDPPSVTCRVRVWPRSAYSASVVPAWLKAEYIATTSPDPAPFPTEADFNNAFGITAGNTAIFNGFVPTYNYFGCCNDPNGDFDFSDLVCQPFREARDAADDFLERLDFLRGDRVAFVTFDRGATIIDPDGTGPQTPMIEVQNDLRVPPITGPIVRRGAQEVLASTLGVRAETTFYTDADNNGQWDGIEENGAGRNQDYYNNAVISEIINHPVAGACPLDSVSMDWQFVPPNGRIRWDNSAGLLIRRSDVPGDEDTPLDDITTRADRSGTMPAWIFTLPNSIGTAPVNSFTRLRDYSYEYRASCAGTNMGGGLGQANYALYLNGRREGAVWLMVFLSDGAAGGTDRVARFDGTVTATNAEPPDPFYLGGPRTGVYVNTYPPQPDPLNGQPPITLTVLEPQRGEYGAYGLCPYGTQANPGEILKDRGFPYCSDRQPDTRTFCGAADTATAPIQTIVDNPANPNCEDTYDVDDYARDWADWIGLSNLQGKPNNGADQLVPSIFTIGFGLRFGYDAAGNPIAPCTATSYDCLRGVTPANQTYVQDYLGEELLRYIADVGDNSRIDSDYWQFQMGARISNGITVTQTAYGPRGACEMSTYTLQSDHMPLPPKVDCGNYYSAASGDELNRVFNEIASRMFTRLSS